MPKLLPSGADQPPVPQDIHLLICVLLSPCEMPSSSSLLWSRQFADGCVPWQTMQLISVVLCIPLQSGRKGQIVKESLTPDLKPLFFPQYPSSHVFFQPTLLDFSVAFFHSGIPRSLPAV